MAKYVFKEFEVIVNDENLIISEDYAKALYDELYRPIVSMIVNAVNDVLPLMNKMADGLGIVPSFQPDAVYNVFMRKQFEVIADYVMIGAKDKFCFLPSAEELYKRTRFMIDNDFIWHMHIHINDEVDYEIYRR